MNFRHRPSQVLRDFWTTPRFVTPVLATYWICLFIVMHIPISRSTPTELPVDKVVHVLVFTLLSGLLTWRLLLVRPITITRQRYLFVGLCLYAAVDELLQIPVGRSAEFGDWLANVVGIVLGIWLAKRLYRRMVEKTPLITSG